MVARDFSFAQIVAQKGMAENYTNNNREEQYEGENVQKIVVSSDDSGYGA
jgi:hypothetical protein